MVSHPLQLVTKTFKKLIKPNQVIDTFKTYNQTRIRNIQKVNIHNQTGIKKVERYNQTFKNLACTNKQR